ncbi:acetyl-CoA synthetase [Rhodoligotrophos appendicifer]|uniref:acyl-CoA synthetase n=1 Tax=Rhodoligotrophos appendicifer TaxID=987056 RepID=UPI001185641C|nr:AMP-binding protein [Rhodoligotrophos appendicifer]
MPKLTDFASYQDAQSQFSREHLWALLDGDEERLNIATECVDRHVGKDVTITILRKEGPEILLAIEDVSRWSNRFANFLVRKGCEKGDRVAIMLDPSLPFYFSLFGAMKAGAVAVPLYTLFGRDGLALRVDDCKPKVLIVDPAKAGIAHGFGATEVIVADEAFLAEVETESDQFEAETSGNDMAMFQYTSGTTRELPDAVKHRHKAVVTVMVAALYGTGIRPEDRFLCPSSPAWGHGLWHGTLAPLALGVKIWAWSGPFDAARLLRALEDHRITNLSAAATHYRLMKNSGQAGNHKYYIEKLTYTGEPTDTATEDFIIETFGQRACSMYGTTEVGVILVNYPGAKDIQVKPRSLGKAVPGVKVEVHDANGNVCAPHAIGELVVERGGEWVRTKDLGWTDKEGYFYHGGRADDVIISAGWTMSAKEIEDTLLKHDSVAEAAVIGVPDELRGQVVKAFVVTGGARGPKLAEDLQTFTRNRLAQHEFPRIIEFVNELPKTPSGKVNRQALRNQDAAAALQRTVA